MPEALAILFVAAVSGSIYLFALVHVAKAAAFEDTQIKLKEWRERQMWIEERLHKARNENWGEDMVGSLLTQHQQAVVHVRSLEENLAIPAPPSGGGPASV